MEVDTPRYGAGYHNLFNTGLRVARSAYYNRQNIAQAIAAGRRAFGNAKRTVETFSRRWKKQKASHPNRKMPRVKAAPGRYAGRFKGPITRARKGSFAVKGHRQHNEVFGQVTQANCAYLGIYSLPRISIGRSVGMALIRYALKREFDRDCSNEAEYIDNSAVTSSAADAIAAVRVHYVEQGAAANAPTYGFLDFFLNTSVTALPAPGTTQWNATLVDFAAWFTGSVFTRQEFGGSFSSVGGQRVITSMNFVRVSIVGSNYVLAGTTNHIPLANLIVKVYSLVKCSIQNITPADDTVGAGALDANRIDSNPLNGRIYKFKGVLPEIASIYNDPVGASNAEREANLIRPAATNAPVLRATPQAGIVDWVGTPPAPDTWANCKYSMPVRLAPGSIKDMSCKFSFDGRLRDLIQGSAVSDNNSNNTGNLNARQRAFGTSMLIALEKTMRTGASNIVLNYHVDWMVGAMVKKSVRVAMPKVYELATELDIT